MLRLKCNRNGALRGHLLQMSALYHLPNADIKKQQMYEITRCCRAVGSILC